MIGGKTQSGYVLSREYFADKFFRTKDFAFPRKAGGLAMLEASEGEAVAPAVRGSSPRIDLRPLSQLNFLHTFFQLFQIGFAHFRPLGRKLGSGCESRAAAQL